MSCKQYNFKFKQVYRYKSAFTLTINYLHKKLSSFSDSIESHCSAKMPLPNILMQKCSANPKIPTPKRKSQWRFSFWHIACVAFRPGTNFTWIINLT